MNDTRDTQRFNKFFFLLRTKSATRKRAGNRAGARRYRVRPEKGSEPQTSPSKLPFRCSYAVIHMHPIILRLVAHHQRLLYFAINFYSAHLVLHYSLERGSLTPPLSINLIRLGKLEFTP